MVIRTFSLLVTVSPRIFHWYRAGRHETEKGQCDVEDEGIDCLHCVCLSVCSWPEHLGVAEDTREKKTGGGQATRSARGQPGPCGHLAL